VRARPLFVAVAIWVGTREPVAACPEVGAIPEEQHGFERQFGATNVNAALGNGGLSVTLSRCGEITTFKWPGPSYYDHLDYLAENVPEARTLPRLGALPEAGAFPGLAYRLRGQRTWQLTWLRDDEWTRTQAYSTEEAPVALTVFHRADLGISVTAWQFVLPDRDVLVNHYEVQRADSSSVRAAKLVFYTNFSPSLERFDGFPLAGFGLDHQDDFVALYDQRTRAILHFRTQSGSYDFIDAALQSRLTPVQAHQVVRQVLSGLDEPGVYIAIGAKPRRFKYQVGFDDSPLCSHQSAIADRAIDAFGFPPDFAELARNLFMCNRVFPSGDPLATLREQRGWVYSAESAYSDVQDGRPSGSPLAAGQASAALVRHLHFLRGQAAVTVYVAVGPTRASALDLLAEARAGDAARHRTATETWWEARISQGRLPATTDSRVLAFAKRSLAVMHQAVDRATGAIVASIAAQPPYGQDWPRDGAFINYALDLAGYPDVVSRHNRFYARVQRKEYQPWSIVYPFVCPADPALRSYPDCVPPGTFEINYFADPDAVVPGGPISFEIDEAGLGAWTMAAHAQFISDPDARAAYLADVCPSIALAADNLAGCKDPATGLQCLASEDDNFELTQGIQGAETVLLALKSASAIASNCGFSPAQVTSWQSRAAELETAIQTHFFVAGPPAHYEGGGRLPWLIWPVEYLAPGDPVTESHADYLWDTMIAPLLARTKEGGAYEAEVLLALAHLARATGNAARLAAVQDAIRFFVHDLTTPDTLHMAEGYGRLPSDLNGDGVSPDYLPQNDIPHVWEHAYLYAAAMIAYGAQ